MANDGLDIMPIDEVEQDPLYAPFKRKDEYGTLGLKPLPRLEKLRLAVLACVVVPIKLLGALCCLVGYYCVCRASLLLSASIRTEFIATCGKLACRACLFCLGFHQVQWIRVQPSSEQQRARPAAIVSNHCSWADILVHMSRSFPAFVAREQTKSMPLIGLIR